MENLGEIIGQNLVFLRKKFGLTQLEFGEKFNYTDKTVSRWENGSIIPSVEVLKQIADFYGVSMDYLTNEHKSAKEFNAASTKEIKYKEKIFFIAIIDSIIWFIAVTVYVASLYNFKEQTLNPDALNPVVNRTWVTFLWSVPATILVSMLFVNHWFKSALAFLILASSFVWTILIAAFITFIYMQPWYLFFVGIPVQIAIFFIYKLRKA